VREQHGKRTAHAGANFGSLCIYFAASRRRSSFHAGRRSPPCGPWAPVTPILGPALPPATACSCDVRKTMARRPLPGGGASPSRWKLLFLAKMPPYDRTEFTQRRHPSSQAFSQRPDKRCRHRRRTQQAHTGSGQTEQREAPRMEERSPPVTCGCRDAWSAGRRWPPGCLMRPAPTLSRRHLAGLPLLPALPPPGGLWG
jgi:hypothetical protein